MCQQLYSAHLQAQSQHAREQTTPSRCGPAVDPRAPRHTQASSQGKSWGSTLPTHPTVASGLLPGGPGPGCCLRCPLCRPASLVGSWPRGCWCWAWPTLSQDKCPRCIQGRWPQPRGPAVPRHLRRVAYGSASWRGQPRSSTQCPGGLGRQRTLATPARHHCLPTPKGGAQQLRPRGLATAECCCQQEGHREGMISAGSQHPRDLPTQTVPGVTGGPAVA